MNINLKLMQTFLLVAEHSSFRAAAERANRSLPAVSMQIKQLETQLGLSLFHRTTRKVELTREGEQLLIRVRKALAELESGLLELKSAAGIESGQITFACVPTVAGTRLPAILAAFNRAYPAVALSLRELPGKDLLEAVRRRDVDFGIAPRMDKMPGFSFQPVLQEDYFAVAPAGFKAGRRNRITVAELARLPLLELAANSVLRDHVDRVLRAHAPQRETRFEMVQASTLVGLVEAGMGVALLPDIAIPRPTALRVLRIVEPTISREIGIVSINAHHLSPAAARMVEFITRLLPAASAGAASGKTQGRRAPARS